METQLFGLLTKRLAIWGLCQAERRNRYDVRAEPHGDSERQADAGGGLRQDLRDGAVEGADGPAERIVNDGPGARLLRTRQLVADAAGDRGRHLDRRVRFLRCRRSRGLGEQRTGNAVAETHYTSPGQTCDQADECSPDAASVARHARTRCNAHAQARVALSGEALLATKGDYPIARRTHAI